MLRSSVLVRAALVLVLVSSSASAQEAIRGASLLPNTTKAYLSIGNVGLLREKFDATQLGELVKDPVMQPFVEDLRQQIDSKLGKSGVKIGINWEDLEGVYGGEVCIAAVQPDGDKKQHALALVVDVGENGEAAAKLLDKVSKNLIAKEAKKTVRKVGAVEMSVFTFPKKKDETVARQVCQALTGGRIIASDHLTTAEGIIRRLTGERKDALEHLDAFHATQERCQKELGDTQPHASFFVDPFGYAEVVRASTGGRKKRGTDLLKVLMNQGFTAIKGIGGNIVFATGEHEFVYRAFVYAPPLVRKDDKIKDKYDLAARMLDFPESDNLTSQPWIPRHVATYASFNVKVKQAFEYIETLVDEMAGDKGVFDDVIESIKTDPAGPMIDIAKDLIGNMGERATLLTDYRLPITPKSERLAVAIELTDVKTVAATIDKAMSADPDAKKRTFEGHVIWEILNESESDKLEVKIDGAGALGHDEEDEPKRSLPNSAVCVANGQLIIASHVDFVVDMLKKAPGSTSLADSADYKIVNAALDKLGAGKESVRGFSRTDETYRPTYELIRQGKMPEAETLLAKILNRLMGPDEEGVLRDQEIDGSKMPDFDAVRRYLGPSGMFTRSEGNGWYITGILLTKDTELINTQDPPAAVEGEKEPVKTAAEPREVK